VAIVGDQKRAYPYLLLLQCLWAYGVNAENPSLPRDLDGIEVRGTREPPPYVEPPSRMLYRTGRPPSVRSARTAKEQETDDRRGCESGSQTAGNPIVLYTGNKVEHETDFSLPGEMGLFLSRTYNHHWNASGLFGNHWLSNFDESLASSQGGDILWIQRPDGRRIRYLQDINASRWYEDKAQPISYITRHADGTYRLHDADRSIEDFSSDGYIIRKQNEQGVAWTYSYAGKYLQRVTHSSGRFIQFTWANGQLTQVTDPSGGAYRFAYTANAFGQGRHRLSSVTLPGAPETTTSYHYEDSRYPGGLTGKSFNGVRYSTFAYDGEGRATLSEHAGGIERHRFSYVVHSRESVGAPPAPARPGGTLPGESNGWCVPRGANGTICYQPASLPGGSVPMAVTDQRASINNTATRTRPIKISTTVTNAYGRRTTLLFDDGKLLEVAGDASPHCPASFKTSTYDSNGYPDLVHDFEDNLTDYDYNAKGQITKEVAAIGTDAELTRQWEWDPTTNRLVTLVIPGLYKSSYTYDPRGNVATITSMNLTGNGEPQQSRMLRYTYTYHANGLRATVRIDGPLEQDDLVETYNSNGDLTSVKNALGHQTTYSNYNALGLPRKITDANGGIAEITYDARGRIVSQKRKIGAGWATSKTTFDSSGNVATVSSPEGNTTRYAYDAGLRRLQEVRPLGDGTFAWTQHTYNDASDLIKTEVRHTDYPLGSAVTGHVDGLTRDATWNWSVAGWACSSGSNGSIDVHVYADDGTLIGSSSANQASETQIANSCQASGAAYRFRVPISLTQRHQLGGKRINVYGISPVGSSHNKLLPGSGTQIVPDAPVLGEIHGISHDSSFNYHINGWACAVGSPTAIQVDAYVTGAYVASAVANLAADVGLVNTCQSGGSAYGFRIPIGLVQRQKLGDKEVTVYGISPAGAAHNRPLVGSATHRIPSAPVIGDIGGVTHDENWNYFVEGWACSVGVNSPITVQAFAGGPASTGSHIITGEASLPTDAKVADACQARGTAYRFRLPLELGTRSAHGGKSIHVHGISPVAGANLVINGSGSYTVPSVVRTAEVVSMTASPTYIVNGQKSQITAQLRNTGNVVWGSDNYLAWGNQTLNMNSALPHSVKPGQAVTFQFNVAPVRQATGMQSFTYITQMATGGATWGPQGSVSITVENPLGSCKPNRPKCEEPIRVSPGIGAEIKTRGR